MNFKNKILTLFQEKKELSVIEIVTELNISKQYVHRVLNQLVENNVIVKMGLPPKTIYKLKVVTENKIKYTEVISAEKEKFLDKNF